VAVVGVELAAETLAAELETEGEESGKFVFRRGSVPFWRSVATRARVLPRVEN